MKTIKLFVLLALTTTFAFSQTTWNIDKVHSNIRFSVAHLVISEVAGNFTDFSGQAVTSKPDDFSDAVFNLTINAESVNTENTDRDKHLRSDNFLDVAKYPNITFKSTKLVKKDDHNYTLTGLLTIHGVTKTIHFDLQYKGTIQDPWGNTRAAFKATSSLSRDAFGLKYKSVMDNGGLVVGDEVTFTVRLELIKAKS
jgi:polyisoprenoid-binding protein YceI